MAPKNRDQAFRFNLFKIKALSKRISTPILNAKAYKQHNQIKKYLIDLFI